MKRKVYAKAVTMCLSAAMLIGMTGVSAKAEESTITFTPVSSIKIGEKLTGKFQYQNNPEGMTPTVNVASREYWDNFIMYGHVRNLPECSSSGTVMFTYGVGQAINVGTVNVDCKLEETFGPGTQYIATYPVEIEEPVITNNLEETYYVNDIIEVQTQLENVVLPEGNIEELRATGNINNVFTYQAQIDVVDGENLVEISEEDYSMALCSSQKVKFTGEGSITFKVQYKPVRIWLPYGSNPDIWGDEMHENLYEVIYKPETYVTVQVVDAKASLSDEIDNAANAGLEQSQYTTESWNTFDQALKNAQAVLESPDSTNEMYVQACQTLKSAREGLVEVSEPIVTPEPEEPTVTPEPEEPTVTPEPSGNNPLTPDDVPQIPSDTDKKDDAEPVKADTVNSQAVKTQAVQTSDENSYFLPVTVSGIAMGLGVVLVYVKRRITARR